MTPERHQRIAELFHRARAYSVPGRAAFLRATCEDDELRLEVEQLLAHDQAPVLELNSGAGWGGIAIRALEDVILSDDNQTHQPPTVTREASDDSGQTIRKVGSYSIIRVIAGGGMGTVYEAVQENPRRVVALKLMRAGLASPSALRRFEYESQVLARLRHPNIAQVYEAGTHREGALNVPYFAMEYIPDAQTITSYVGDKKLGTRDRLVLFGQVCDAVHHGHQKGVIHRDLKPSNLLVESSGQVKIIDFGVARATDSDLAVTTLHTDVGQLIGTLQYMSPEQCEADPHNIDTRSDIYALGVVFYELLTDRLPYDVRGSAIHEAIRVIREQPPTKPSTLDKTLRGDLETIAMKALEKDRDRRYPSAFEFQQDILRYLRGDAISARRPSLMYQARVFARRHRGFLAAVAAVILALTAGLVGTALMYIRAAQERDRAQESDRLTQQSLEETQQARDESEQVTQFLSDMLAAVKPEERGRDVTVREVLDKSAATIGEKLSDKPLIEARLRETVGLSYWGLGLLEAAEQQLAQSAAISAHVHGPQHPSTLRIMTHHAMVIGERGDIGMAEASLRSTLEILRRVLGEEDPGTIATMNNLANTLTERARYAEAEELHRRVLEFQLRTLGPEHRDTLITTNCLANNLYAQSRYAEAGELYRLALDNQIRVVGEEHPNSLTSLNSLANVASRRGHFAEAEVHYRRILEIQRRVLGEEHRDMLVTAHNLANSLLDQNRYAEAEELYRSTLQTRRRVLGEEHPDTLGSMMGLAMSLNDQGRHAEAEALHRKTLEIRRRVLGDEHPKTLNSMSNLAKCLGAQDRYAEAEELHRKTLEARRRVFGSDHPDVARSLYAHCVVLEKMERLAEAEQSCREAQTILSAHLPPEHGDRIRNTGLLGSVLCGLGRYAEAEPLLIESCAALMEDSGVPPAEKQNMVENLIQLYASWNPSEPEAGHDTKAQERLLIPREGP